MMQTAHTHTRHWILFKFCCDRQCDRSWRLLRSSCTTRDANEINIKSTCRPDTVQPTKGDRINSPVTALFVARRRLWLNSKPKWNGNYDFRNTRMRTETTEGIMRTFSYSLVDLNFSFRSISCVTSAPHLVSVSVSALVSVSVRSRSADSDFTLLLHQNRTQQCRLLLCCYSVGQLLHRNAMFFTRSLFHCSAECQCFESACPVQ